MHIYLNFKEIRKKKIDICFTSLECSRNLVVWSTLDFFQWNYTLIQRKVAEEAIAVPFVNTPNGFYFKEFKSTSIVRIAYTGDTISGWVRREQNGPSVSSCYFCCCQYH